MNQEDKLKERIILLTRLYWIDELHKIGIELNIDSIKKIQNSWDLEQYKAAYEIAQHLDDNQLEKLLASYTPKHMKLGGFQGKFYSLDEKCHLTFTSSWPSVKENVKKALALYQNKAYGVLKALANKNGESEYFDLIDEIGKVLGKEYVPSFLLPRLAPLKLVFKTGSNRYPLWTMPTEIIPAVEEELRNYQLIPEDNQLPLKQRSVQSENSVKTTKWDVFISHASEDKEAVARPFAERLTDLGLKVWYDEFSLQWGKSLRKSIEEGLKNSSYGIVILSQVFFQKTWTNLELDGLVAIMTTTGKDNILPLRYGLTHKEVADISPTLAGLFSRSWDEGIDKLANDVKDLVRERKKKTKQIAGNPNLMKYVSKPIENSTEKITESVKVGSDEFDMTLDKFTENGNHYVGIRNHRGKTIKSCSILCDNQKCKWWDEDNSYPRHIPEGGAMNVMLPHGFANTNPMISVMSGDEIIEQTHLSKIVRRPSSRWDAEDENEEKLEAKINTKNYEKAIEIYDRILKAEPKDVITLKNKADLLFQLNRYREAIVSYDKILQINPNDVHALANKGAALSNLGRVEETLELFDKALQIDPKSVLVLNNKGLALGNMGKREESLIWFDKALQINPKFVLALTNKGTALLELGKRQEALDYHTKAHDIDPTNFLVLTNIGYTYEMLNQHEEAIKWYDKSLEINPLSLPTLNNKGLTLCHIGNYKEAILCFDKVLSIDSTNIMALTSKGYALNNLKRYEESLEFHDKALKLDQNNTLALTNKGHTLTMMKKPKEAMIYFQKALKFKPDNTKALYFMALLTKYLERFNEAEMYCKKLLEITPEDISAIELSNQIEQEKTRKS